MIIEVLKYLVDEKLASLNDQKKWLSKDLLDILNPIIKEAETFEISNSLYLNLFGLNHTSTVTHVWKHLFNLVKGNISKSHHHAIEIILNKGSLATRILNAIDKDFTEPHIKKVYNQLAHCLQENKLFDS